MLEWTQIGKQRFRRLPNGLFIEMHGTYGLDEAQVIYPLLAALWRDNSDPLVLVDCHDISGGMSAEVRRYVVKFARENTIRGDTVIIGGSLLVSTLVKMVLGAIKLVAAQLPRIHFVRSEAEAWTLTTQLRPPKGR